MSNLQEELEKKGAALSEAQEKLARVHIDSQERGWRSHMIHLNTYLPTTL